MRSNFAFFVIFGTIFLLFLLNETLAGGTSSKHKSRKSERSQTKRQTNRQKNHGQQPWQIGKGVLQGSRDAIVKASKEAYQGPNFGSQSSQWQTQHDMHDHKDNGSTRRAKGRRGGTSKNCTIQ
ncbi:hypothetical protein niasHT_013777 [Heterodera trifolii]|uniref:Secreted protein n=1 Tax=Heterodera trifolii TaxID=157864 RepID=A0ABD2KTU1_9BILA